MKLLPFPRALVLPLQFLWTVGALTALVLWWPEDLWLEEWLVWGGCAFFTAHSVWAFWSWAALAGRKIDGYSLFLMSLVLFNGGQMILETFGLLPDGLLGGDARQVATQRAVMLVNSAMTTFHLGALFIARRAGAGSPVLYSSSRARRVALTMLVLGLPGAFIATYLTASIVAHDGYMAVYQGAALVGAENWAAASSILVTPGVLFLAARPRSRSVVWFGWFVILARTAAALFVGWRANAVLTLIPMLVVHHHFVRPLRRRTLVVAVAVGVLVLPSIAAIRNLGIAERLEMRSADDAPSAALMLLLKEMGGTLSTVAHTTELVPSTRDYDHGRGYLFAALTPIPNLFWDVHPAHSRGSYSTWLSWQVDPIWAELGGGVGFSMVAEAFINFGPAGTPILFLVAGALLAAFVSRCRQGRGGAIVFEAVALSVLLFLPRSETNVVIRPLVWCLLVPYLVMRTRARRKTAPSALSLDARGVSDVRPI